MCPKSEQQKSGAETVSALLKVFMFVPHLIYRISSPISRAIFSVFDPKFWEILHEEWGSACSRGFYILKIYSC